MKAWNKGKTGVYSEETKKKFSESFKRVWANPEYRKRMLQIIKTRKKRLPHSEITKKKMSESIRKALNTPEISKKRTQLNIERWSNKEYKERLMKKFHSPETMKKYFQRVYPFKDTSIEIKLQKNLSELGISFEKHKTIKLICQTDLFIKPNICIFADGCYFHGCQECLDKNKFTNWQRAKMMRDIIQEQSLINNNYIVLRFWEHEINSNIDNVIERIVEKIPIEVIL